MLLPLPPPILLVVRLLPQPLPLAGSLLLVLTLVRLRAQAVGGADLRERGVRDVPSTGQSMRTWLGLGRGRGTTQNHQ